MKQSARRAREKTGQDARQGQGASPRPRGAPRARTWPAAMKKSTSDIRIMSHLMSLTCVVRKQHAIV